MGKKKGKPSKAKKSSAKTGPSSQVDAETGKDINTLC
jgi:hypothetical protein